MMDLVGNPEKLKDILEDEGLNKPSLFFYRNEEHRTFKGLITWSVKKLDLNFNRFGESKECVFSIGSPDFCKLKLRIFPCGTTENTKNFVLFSMCFLDELPRNSWYQCTVSIINKTGELLKSDSKTGRGENVNAVNFNCFTETKRLPEFYFDDKIIVQCAVKICCNSYYSNSDDAEFSVDDNHVVKIPTKKCFDKLPTDVVFESKGSEPIHANKALLMCEAPTLTILLKGAPADEDKFRLPFTTAPLFKDILDFIYAKNIRFSSFQHACKLYDAACCFQMNELKDICSTYIGGNLSENNLFVTQTIAHNYCNEELMRACFEFIKTSDSKKLAHSSMLSLDKI